MILKIRRIYCKWWVNVTDSEHKVLTQRGPYDTIEQATDAQSVMLLIDSVKFRIES